MNLGNHVIFLGGQKRRAQCHILDASARYWELLRQLLEVNLCIQRRGRREMALPNPNSLSNIRKRKLDNEADAPSERLVHILTKIGCQNDDPVVLFHFLQQEASFD